MGAQLGESGQGVLVEREPLVQLPGGDELDGALTPPPLAAHPADDLLGERDPELVVVGVVGVTLERVERRRPRLLVQLRVEPEPVPLADLAVALRPELWPGPGEREVDVEDDGFQHGTRG